MVTKEEYVKRHGWTHHHGYIIDNSMICDEYDKTLVLMEQLKETMTEGDFWLSEDGPGYEDIEVWCPNVRRWILTGSHFRRP